MAAVFALSASVEAQQSKLEDYFKRKDANQNGRVEPEEMSDNTRSYLRKLGFDSSKSVSISRIVSKVNNDKKASSAKSAKSNRTRKVPGFGVEKETESTGVARFGSSESATGGSTKAVKYSDSVNRQVEDTMRKNDRNKDGVLDRGEIRSGRWGSPPPEQSDTNRDGRLTRTELSKRYAAREQYYSKSSSDRSREQAKRKEAEDRSRREKERSRYRSSISSSSSSNRSSFRTTPSSTRGSSSSKSSDSLAKYEKYADSLISQYDENKDGKLSKDETKKMRRPPAGADADKNGYITKSELVGSLSGTNKASTSTKTASSSDKDKSSRYSRDRGGYDRGSSRSSSRSGSSSSFEKLDANIDNHVQMHEFATKWDDETVSEFYEKDKNGDGVITLREWTGKN